MKFISESLASIRSVSSRLTSFDSIRHLSFRLVLTWFISKFFYDLIIKNLSSSGSSNLCWKSGFYNYSVNNVVTYISESEKIKLIFLKKKV